MAYGQIRDKFDNITNVAELVKPDGWKILGDEVYWCPCDFRVGKFGSDKVCPNGHQHPLRDIIPSLSNWTS